MKQSCEVAADAHHMLLLHLSDHQLSKVAQHVAVLYCEHVRLTIQAAPVYMNNITVICFTESVVV